MIVSFRGLLPIHESLLFGSSTFLMAPYGDYWKFMKKLIVSNLLGSQALERSRGILAPGGRSRLRERPRGVTARRRSWSLFASDLAVSLQVASLRVMETRATSLCRSG
ncbi:hypothetical protein YC2023_081642 [Brassica napus]